MISSIFLSIFILIAVIYLIENSKNRTTKSKYYSKKKKHDKPKIMKIQANDNIKHDYLTVKELAKYFNLDSKELNNILVNLQWINKSNRWLIATPIGLNIGAKQKYNTKNKSKYIRWKSQVKNNIDLLDAIDIYKNNKLNNTYYETNRNKKEKGDKYEAYIADYFRQQGYYVWEHGKEKGILDGGIDLLIKKGKFCFFVQCKDWETWKVDDKTIKATQTDVRNYMLENSTLTQLLRGTKKKILYITSKECLTKGAYRYIEENKNIMEYKVIAY